MMNMRTTQNVEHMQSYTFSKYIISLDQVDNRQYSRHKYGKLFNGI